MPKDDHSAAVPQSDMPKEKINKISEKNTVKVPIVPRGSEGLLLLFLLLGVSWKFDPSGIPLRRLVDLSLPLVTGTALWAVFHLLVSYLLSPILLRKLSAVYGKADALSYRDLDAQRCEFLNRMVSLAHALLSFSSAIYVLSQGFDIGHRNSELQSVLLTLSSTYFLFDYLYVTYCRIGDHLDTIHHFIALGGLLSSLLIDQCGGEVVCAIVVTEVSNPFLHTRKLLQILKLHKQHSVLFKYNNYLFALSYLIGRMFFGAWFVFRTVTSPNSPLLMKVSKAPSHCQIAYSLIIRAGRFLINVNHLGYMVQAHFDRRKSVPGQQSSPAVARRARHLDGVAQRWMCETLHLRKIESYANGSQIRWKRSLLFKRTNCTIAL
jgi:hypothetical protein